MHRLGQSAFRVQKSRHLPQPFLGLLGGDFGDIMLGERFADFFQDLAQQIIAADIVERLPDRRHDHALILGVENQRRGRCVALYKNCGRPRPEGRWLWRSTNPERTNSFNCSVTAVRVTSIISIRLVIDLWRIAHQKLDNPHSGSTNDRICHVL